MMPIVSNGTNAGWRVVRERPKDWRCPGCKVTLRYYWSTCPNCGTQRTQEDHDHDE